MSTRMTPSDAANITRHLLALVEAEPSEEAKGVVKRVTDHLREYIKTETAGVIDDGGPIHPGTEANGLNSGWSGMSLRDYFATHADIGSVDELSVSWGEAILGRACPLSADKLACYRWWADYRAAMRYMEADAMLAARKGGAA